MSSKHRVSRRAVRPTVEVDALCEAVRAAYPQGPDAVLAIVRAAFALLAERMTELETDVAELRTRLGADSTTSSRPPSTDVSRAMRRRPRSLREKSGKRAGAQVGHRGHTLGWRGAPDAMVEHTPAQCDGCGQDLGAHGRRSGRRVLERAQVYDLAPIVLSVTEHHRVAVVCWHCGHESSAPFPLGITAGVQYGREVKALAVALHSYHLLPYARTAEFLAALLEDGPSAGSIVRWTGEAAEGLERASALAARSVTTQYAAHADETSVHIAGARYWLHVAATATHTHYHVHEKRGFIGIDAAGVWAAFHGVMVHDGWWPYGRYRAARHQLCLAHLRREALGLVTLTQETGHAERWLAEIEALLHRLHRLVRRAAAAGRPTLARGTITQLTTQYDAITSRARRRHPYPKPGRDNRRPGRPKRGAVAAFADRLIKYRDDVLRCAHDTRIPPDNNQAERDIRMVKLADKITGGFRTVDGARRFCTIRSALSTARKHGDTVIAVLRRTFGPQPPVGAPAPTC